MEYTLRPDELAAFKASFDMFDKNQDGTISTKVNIRGQLIYAYTQSILFIALPDNTISRHIVIFEFNDQNTFKTDGFFSLPHQYENASQGFLHIFPIYNICLIQ